MDQSTLVGDQIQDGRRIIERFAADGNAVQAAFWVREADEGSWRLYVATDLVDREGPAAAYLALDLSLQKLGQPGALGDRIMVVRPDYPIARDVLAIMKQNPDRSRVWRAQEIETSAEDQIYIYPARFFTFTQPNPMTSDEIAQEIVQLMSRGGDMSQPSRVMLKDGTSFDGVPFSLQSGGRNALLAGFIGENEVAPRIYRLDEIASIG